MKVANSSFVDGVCDYLAQEGTFLVGEEPFVASLLRIVQSRDGTSVSIHFGLDRPGDAGHDARGISLEAIRSLREASDEGHGYVMTPLEIEIDPATPGDDDSLAVKWGKPVFQFTFRADLDLHESKDEFRKFLEDCVRIQEHDRREELEDYRSIIQDEPPVGTEDDEEEAGGIPMEAIEDSMEFAVLTYNRGAELASAARLMVLGYYAFSSVPILCLAAILVSFGPSPSLFPWAIVGIIVYFAAVEAMKRLIVLAQRQFSIAEFHMLGVLRMSRALNHDGVVTTQTLGAAKRDVSSSLDKAKVGCHRRVGLINRVPPEQRLAFAEFDIST